jgi:cell division protein FtsQ
MKPNYIEFNDGDEPQGQEHKSDGSYVEPSKDAPLDAKSEQGETMDRRDEKDSLEETEGGGAAKQKEILGMFVWNAGAIQTPKTVVFLTVVLGLVAVFVLAKFWTREAELSRFIIQGNTISKTEEITSVASKFIGKKMNEANLSEIIDTVSTLPYIRKVVATKEFPNAIRLRIQERSAVASALIGGRLKLIDEAGFVLSKNEHVLESTRLPLLTGFEKISLDSATGLMMLDSAETASALAFCTALRKTEWAKLLISEVHISSASQMVAFAASANAKFLFSGGAHQENLSRFELFWKQVIVKKGVNQFDYVDVRFDGKIFAKEIQTTVQKQ